MLGTSSTFARTGGADRVPFEGPILNTGVRQFSAGYLADTRRGLWADRSALVGFDLPNRERILDVGCGTGAFASVLREEAETTVVCLDADRSLLAEITHMPRLQGDAVQLPLGDDTFDLAACQALLVNLPDPVAAVRELARVSWELVGAVEPDNADVTVESTVEAETTLSARARRSYLEGLETDATLGAATADVFRSVGLRDITTTRHELVRETAPPYEPRDVEAAKRKLTASRLREHEAELRAGEESAVEYETLVDEWREMGRSVVDQMQAEEYHRIETVPFYVTVGRV